MPVLSIDVHQVMLFCLCLLLLSLHHISSSSSSSLLSYQRFPLEYFGLVYDFQEMPTHSQGLHLMIIRIKDQRSEGGTQLGRVFTAIQFTCQLKDFCRSVKKLKLSKIKLLSKTYLPPFRQEEIKLMRKIHISS